MKYKMILILSWASMIYITPSFGFELNKVSTISQNIDFTHHIPGVQFNDSTVITCVENTLILSVIRKDSIYPLSKIFLGGNILSYAVSNMVVFAAIGLPVCSLVKIDYIDPGSPRVINTVEQVFCQSLAIIRDSLYVNQLMDNNTWRLLVFTLEDLKLAKNTVMPHKYWACQFSDPERLLIPTPDTLFFIDRRTLKGLSFLNQIPFSFPASGRFLAKKSFVFGSNEGLRVFNVTNSGRKFSQEVFLPIPVNMFVQADTGTLCILSDTACSILDLKDQTVQTIGNTSKYNPFSTIFPFKQGFLINTVQGDLYYLEKRGSGYSMQTLFRSKGRYKYVHYYRSQCWLVTELGIVQQWDLKNKRSPRLIRSYTLDLPVLDVDFYDSLMVLESYSRGNASYFAKSYLLRPDTLAFIDEIVEVAGPPQYVRNFGFITFITDSIITYRRNFETVSISRNVHSVDGSIEGKAFSTDNLLFLSDNNGAICYYQRKGHQLEFKGRFEIYQRGVQALYFYKNFLIISNLSNGNEVCFVDLSDLTHPVWHTCIKGSGTIQVDPHSDLLFSGRDYLNVWDLTTLPKKSISPLYSEVEMNNIKAMEIMEQEGRTFLVLVNSGNSTICSFSGNESE